MPEHIDNRIREDPQARLTPFDIELLASLPPAPNGLSMHELADGLLDSRGPPALGEIKTALDRIGAEFGEDDAEALIARRGNDDFGRADVPLYGVPREHRARVREFFQEEHV